MRRRDVIALAGATTLGSPFARAQQRVSPVRILIVGAVAANLGTLGLRSGLSELGYVEGRDVSIDYFAGEFADLVEVLDQRRIDVVFAVASQAVIMAQRATRTVPIVAVDLESEPVVDGLMTSIARPGGNLTGLFLDSSSLGGKWMQLITEAVPGASRLAVVRDRRLADGQWRAIQTAARTAGMELQEFEFKGNAFEAMFGDIAGVAPHALVILSSPLIVPNRMTLAALAIKARLPSISLFKLYARAGGLLAYGPDPYVMSQHAARYVDKILKGTKPGDLPAQLPTTFELVVNLRTATALGLVIPPSILARADEMID